MAFTPGDKITAADFNNLITQLNAVNGIGTGNSGYGESDLSLVESFPFNPNADKVKASTLSKNNDWADLTNAIQIIGQHQDNIPSLPTIGQPGDDIEIGDPIQAFSEFQPAIDQVTANRNIAGLLSTTLTSAVLVSGRNDPFSSQIQHVFTVDFGSDDDARFFFNTGGQIRIAMNAPDNVASHNWGGVYNAAGTYIFDSSEFYSISSTINNFTTVQIATSGGGIYSTTNNQWIIRVRFIAGTSNNGARGSKLEFTSLTDDQGTTPPDIVIGNFISTISELRSTAFFNRPAPTFETISELGSFSPLAPPPTGPTDVIVNSLIFDQTRNMFLDRTFGVADDVNIWSFSTWVKRGNIGTGTQTIFSGGFAGSGPTQDGADILFRNDQLEINAQQSNVLIWRLRTNAVFTDPTAWYHIVWSFDNTNAISSDRIKLYVNGIRLTDFEIEAQPELNQTGLIKKLNQLLLNQHQQTTVG